MTYDEVIRSILAKYIMEYIFELDNRDVISCTLPCQIVNSSTACYTVNSSTSNNILSIRLQLWTRLLVNSNAFFGHTP